MIRGARPIRERNLDEGAGIILHMPKVTCLPNGPYIVDGPIEVFDSTGKAFDLGGKARIALCRCAHSKTKPFCDGGHKAGFVAEDSAPRKL